MMRVAGDEVGGGRHALSLLSPRCALGVLGQLAAAKCFMSAAELAAGQGAVARSVLDEYLLRLRRRGALQSHPRPAAGRTRDLCLTPYGWGLVELSERLVACVKGAPRDPQRLDVADSPTREVIASHAEGWAGPMLRRLGRNPRMRSALVAELIRDPASASVGMATADQVQGRLRRMELSGQIAVADRVGTAIRYTAAPWAGLLAGPLAYATALESRHDPPGSRPPKPEELQTIIALAAGALDLPSELSGSIAIGIDAEHAGRIEVVFRVEAGTATEDHPPDPGEPDPGAPTARVEIRFQELLEALLAGRDAPASFHGDEAAAMSLFEAFLSVLRARADRPARLDLRT